MALHCILDAASQTVWTGLDMGLARRQQPAPAAKICTLTASWSSRAKRRRRPFLAAPALAGCTSTLEPALPVSPVTHPRRVVLGIRVTSVEAQKTSLGPRPRHTNPIVFLFAAAASPPPLLFPSHTSPNFAIEQCVLHRVWYGFNRSLPNSAEGVDLVVERRAFVEAAWRARCPIGHPPGNLRQLTARFFANPPPTFSTLTSLQLVLQTKEEPEER